jgi:hypothetical protein
MVATLSGVGDGVFDGTVVELAEGVAVFDTTGVDVGVFDTVARGVCVHTGVFGGVAVP